MNIEELKIKYRNLKDQLGKKPSNMEFYPNTGVSEYHLTKFFGNEAYSKLVEECGDISEKFSKPNRFKANIKPIWSVGKKAWKITSMFRLDIY